MTNSVRELVEAAKRAKILLRTLTVRQVLEGGYDAMVAAGLNPYCVNEGRAGGSEAVGTWWLRSAIAAVEAEGDGWIEIKEGCDMPKDDFNVLVWIPNQTLRGGYWDLASYGDYVCEDEDCRPGDPNYVEGDDEGNRRGNGWHRQEETHGGPYDYVYIDLNNKVTHWRPLPTAPTMSGKEPKR